MSQKKIEIEALEKDQFYDYNQSIFSPKDSNFLKYINDSSRNLDEFLGFVQDHIETFMDIIETFKRLIKIQVGDEDGKEQMKDRIVELKETIKTLEFVLKDVKENPLGKKRELKPE